MIPSTNPTIPITNPIRPSPKPNIGGKTQTAAKTINTINTALRFFLLLTSLDEEFLASPLS